MRRLSLMLVLALVAALGTVAATAASAGVLPDKGTGCIVTDAVGAGFLDPDCAYHIVLSESGDILQYQDHGQLPDGAAFPKKAITRTVCYAPFLSREVITPSGDYKSTLLGAC
jgi:hypothetical protein